MASRIESSWSSGCMCLKFAAAKGISQENFFVRYPYVRQTLLDVVFTSRFRFRSFRCAGAYPRGG
jgi:hypothetical protein